MKYWIIGRVKKQNGVFKKKKKEKTRCIIVQSDLKMSNNLNPSQG